MLAWMVWVACLHRWRTCLGGVLVWVAYLCRKHTSMVGVCGMGDVLACWAWVEWGLCFCVNDVLSRVAYFYYCYCYYWNASLKSKMLNVYFWNENEKMFQIALESNLKKELDLKNRCWFTLFRPVMQGSWVCLNHLNYAWMWLNIPR